MSILFSLFLVILVTIKFNYRQTAVGLIVTTLLLCMLMLWHHATDILQINW